MTSREEMEKKVAEEFSLDRSEGDWSDANGHPVKDPYDSMADALVTSRMREEEMKGTNAGLVEAVNVAGQTILEIGVELSSLRSSLAEAKGEREKELREAFEECKRIAGVMRDCTGADHMQDICSCIQRDKAFDSALVAFLASRKEGG